MGTSKYKVSKGQKSKYEIEQMICEVRELFDQKDTFCVGISTSTKLRDNKRFVFDCIAEHEKNNENGIYCIDIDEKEINKKDLEKMRNNHKYIIVNLPPISISSEAMEIARECDTLVLVEKYAHTKYSEFEKTLAIIKQENINLAGVISA